MTRKRRFRLTIGRLMLATAFLAVACWWAICRPYPTMVPGLGPTSHIFWSDGTATTCEAPTQIRCNSWFMAVDFGDGRTRYYLTLR